MDERIESFLADIKAAVRNAASSGCVVAMTNVQIDLFRREASFGIKIELMGENAKPDVVIESPR